MRKLIIAAVAAASVLATPAMARGYGSYGTHYPTGYSHNPYGSYGARYVGWRGCYPAPRVGAFATAPWTYDTPCEPAPAY